MVNMDETPKERADIATRFQKGNEIWKLAQKAGRPHTWTEEDVLSLAQRLREWMQKEDSICMRGFTSENNITYSTMIHLGSKFPELEHLYTMAKEKVANRLAQRLGKQVHPAYFNRYQAVYDNELKFHEKEMANVKAHQEDEQQKEAELRAFEISSKIAEQMKAHLDKGKS
jgi:hypothetical protein